MKKILVIVLILLLIPAGLILVFLANGTIHTSSIRMILNVAGVANIETSTELVENRLVAAEGFQIQLYASNLKNARFLRFTENGDLLVSRPHAGDIKLLKKDRDGDNKPDAVSTLIANLNRPQGMDFIGSWLYIAESNRIGRIQYDTASGQTRGAYEIVVDDLTDNGNHWTKTIRVGADGLLYLTQGSSCNVCDEEDQRRATLMRFQPDGSKAEILATGLRNSVGFDWAPWNGEIFATDNARDLMGDDFPPCELNQISIDGFYGWPYFNGDNVPDPDMGADPRAGERSPIAPAHNFNAHNAPLGITFLDGKKLPGQYEKSALVALHGSWNRSEPDGYKVVSLHWGEEGIEERDFLFGFNNNSNIVGRPVDAAQGPDGDIFISDDYAGAVYRLRYGESGAGELRVTPSNQSDQTLPDWLDGADLATMANAGEQLFLENDCATCHNDNAGQVSLAGLSQRLGYAGVITALEQPVANMPIYEFSELEQREIAAYLLSRD